MVSSNPVHLTSASSKISHLYPASSFIFTHAYRVYIPHPNDGIALGKSDGWCWHSLCPRSILYTSTDLQQCSRKRGHWWTGPWPSDVSIMAILWAWGSLCGAHLLSKTDLSSGFTLEDRPPTKANELHLPGTTNLKVLVPSSPEPHFPAIFQGMNWTWNKLYTFNIQALNMFILETAQMWTQSQYQTQTSKKSQEKKCNEFDPNL